MREPPLILVVDDVPDNVEILQLRLESQGYEVITAGDGEAALAIIRDRLPDLVLLDIQMPKLDGIETVKQLKADDSLPFIPVIMVGFWRCGGFSGVAGTREPGEVRRLLREYPEAVGPIVTRSESTLGHFAGDGIMVFFKDPLPWPDPGERGVKMAVEMREAV